jgi:hypothetical protein
MGRAYARDRERDEIQSIETRDAGTRVSRPRVVILAMSRKNEKGEVVKRQKSYQTSQTRKHEERVESANAMIRLHFTLSIRVGLRQERDWGKCRAR